LEIKALGEQAELQNRGSRPVGEVEVVLISTDEKRYVKHWVHTDRPGKSKHFGVLQEKYQCLSMASYEYAPC